MSYDQIWTASFNTIGFGLMFFFGYLFRGSIVAYQARKAERERVEREHMAEMERIQAEGDRKLIGRFEAIESRLDDYIYGRDRLRNDLDLLQNMVNSQGEMRIKRWNEITERLNKLSQELGNEIVPIIERLDVFEGRLDGFKNDLDRMHNLTAATEQRVQNIENIAKKPTRLGRRKVA